MGITVDVAELEALCCAAAVRVGAGPAMAKSLALATVSAERRGKSNVGVAHFFDYLDALAEGRINGDAHPTSTIDRGCLLVDADDGIAQFAVDVTESEFIALARHHGIALLAVRRSYTCGELGYLTMRFAHHGLVAFASANAPALMALPPATTAIVGTNPFAASIPRPDDAPVTIDQASSRTAYVNLREAAQTGRAIPNDWALGPDGAETTDPVAGMAGALLPFGGYKGANVALVIELLAGMAGGNWSLEAPPFDRGDQPPRVALTLVAIDMEVFGVEQRQRVGDYLDQLHRTHEVHLPGSSTARPDVYLAENDYAELVAAASGTPRRASRKHG
jgi:(2R)-3-sulfolactate dehydrogenase (NADP+)